MSMSTADRQTVNDAIAILERETANDGDSIVLRGFGTFKRAAKPARTARNPATGAAIQVPAKSVLTFKAAPATKRVL